MNEGRHRDTFDFGWKFTRGDVDGGQAEDYADSKWQPVDLPHDWSIAGPFDASAPVGGNGGYLPTGIGWYRKRFSVPAFSADRRISIEFDGVYEKCEVWINGHSLGRRPYGYTSFAYNLTPYLHTDKSENVLAVRVDNSAQPNSRWYSGSGIYRHTWLIQTVALHIPTWGTFVKTPSVTPEAAAVEVKVRVENDQGASAEFGLAYAVLDADGHSIASGQATGDLAAETSGEFKQQLNLPRPRLWSVTEPYLYTFRCQVLRAGKVVDEYDTPFGVRTAVFDVDRGFLLNGVPVKMNGVCLHHDGGGVGAAVPEGVWLRRLKLLKQMGCNAIRTSHNPPAPEFLDLCDKMGFLVMDEAFDEWEAGKRQHAYHESFKEWWKQDLMDFVRRDRNHPSVVIWSAGNEIYEQSAGNGLNVLKPLVETFHAEDPTRPVTAACDRVAADPDPARPDFLALLDVAGYNYVDRWRDLTNQYYSIDRRTYPNRKFIGTESTSMAGVRGDYHWLFATPKPPAPDNKFPKPPYGNVLIDVEQLWKSVRTNDYVSGDFMWTGIDYLGEAGWPNKIATFGALDTCGFKKDGYFFYQSQWTSDPVLHLSPHWNLQGREGQIIPVTCYTNCDTVELFLNGKSFGVKGYEFPRKGMEGHYANYPPRTFMVRTTADLHLSWDVPYGPGTLRAVGMLHGKEVVTEVTTTGTPASIKLTCDTNQLMGDGRDVAHVTFEVVDADGRIVPTADNDVSFQLSGPARLLCVDNGNPVSDESFVGDHRRVFNGMGLAVIQSKLGSAGNIRLIAHVEGMPETVIELKCLPVPGSR